MTAAARRNPMGGDMTRPIKVVPTVAQWIAFGPPPAAMPAPSSPPTNAWVELDGNPKYQVRRFHAIAPSSAAMMTTRAGFATRPEIGFDTLLPKRSEER